MCLAMIHYRNCSINRHSYSYSTCVLAFRSFSKGVILKSAFHGVHEWHENNGRTHKLWPHFWEVFGFLQWIKHMNHRQTQSEMYVLAQRRSGYLQSLIQISWAWPIGYHKKPLLPFPPSLLSLLHFILFFLSMFCLFLLSLALSFVPVL